MFDCDIVLHLINYRVSLTIEYNISLDRISKKTNDATGNGSRCKPRDVSTLRLDSLFPSRYNSKFIRSNYHPLVVSRESPEKADGSREEYVADYTTSGSTIPRFP